MQTTLFHNAPEFRDEFRDRVAAGQFDAALRFARVLGLHRIEPQRLFERDDRYVRRLARRFCRAHRRGASKSPGGMAAGAPSRSIAA